MKKGFILILAVALLAGFASCDKDDDAPALGADIKVTVVNWPGSEKDGVTVYMYKDDEITSSTKKDDAKDQVVTDKNGVADFKLNFTKLNVFEKQTTFYFAVFYNDLPVGSEGVTVERNKAYEVTITIPL